ncbi:MAG: deoxyribose-phosphate aldolase [Cyanobacteria bacterium P01_E01_bin.34]
MTDFPSDLDLAPYIDHSLLDPTAVPGQVERLCREADRFGFASVCLLPCNLKQAVDLLHNRPAKVTTVIGFPLGGQMHGVKLYEAMAARDAGAQELDVVINVGWLKAGESDLVHGEIAQIVEATSLPVKAILETAVLTEEEKRLAGELCADAGVAFLKTSTGWRGGATVGDVKLLWEITRGQVAVKASGGIKTVEGAVALIDAGATRLGTSRGVQLMQQWMNAGDSEVD